MPQTGDLKRRLAVARGDEPADLVVRGGRVLSVFTREWLDVDVAICDGTIAGLGSYEGRVLPGARRFAEHGAVAEGRELPQLEQVSLSARGIHAGELLEDDDRAELTARRLRAAE